MAKSINRLSALKVVKLSKKGWYPDGAGLYLQVSPSQSKSWVYRYQVEKKEKRIGLGSYPKVKLETARKYADDCVQLRKQGIDPIEHKNKQKIEDLKILTFSECAHEYIESHQSGWRNKKHATQWQNTLETYVFPVFGTLPVNEVDTILVLKALKPLWLTKTETGTRVRQRIENILDWAKVMNLRSGENPALWRGHLDKLLPKRSKVQKVKHHAALPFVDLPDFYRSLRTTKTVVARALCFTILTGVRTGEVRFAKWDEINLKNKTWIIPELRMKMEKEHKVPLSSEVISILNEMQEIKKDAFIFSGTINGKPISDAAMLQFLKKIYPDKTVHGFRSTFRDWISETTNFSHSVAESALAHAISNDVEAAYRRGDLFKKRTKLMDAWSSYCVNGQTHANVISLNGKKAV